MNHFYLRVHSSSDTAKVIISVSKKVSKKAVVRNSIRRRIRPIMHQFISSLKPATYLIVAKTGAGEIKGKELENELRSLVVGYRL